MRKRGSKTAARAKRYGRNMSHLIANGGVGRWQKSGRRKLHGRHRYKYGGKQKWN